jgi:hypothetical protein
MPLVYIIEEKPRGNGNPSKAWVHFAVINNEITALVC